jgi:para-nitrobenzyl esterase
LKAVAKKGIFFVNLNYRLGLLGFLAHPELSKESSSKTSGNYGLLDCIAAFRWIHNNIAAFGGAPNRVTIAGQSAGGMAVHDLIASPLAKGIFHRGVVESGGSSIGGGGITIRAQTLADAEGSGQNFGEAKGAPMLKDLRAMSWLKLIEPLPSADGGRGASGLMYSPIVDKYVLLFRLAFSEIRVQVSGGAFSLTGPCILSAAGKFCRL